MSRNLIAFRLKEPYLTKLKKVAKENDKNPSILAKDIITWVLDDDKFLSKMLISKKNSASEYDVYLSEMISFMENKKCITFEEIVRELNIDIATAKMLILRLIDGGSISIKKHGLIFKKEFLVWNKN